MFVRDVDATGPDRPRETDLMSGPRPEDPGGPFWDPLKPGRERSPLPFLAESGPPIGRTPRQLVEERRRRRILLGALNVFGEKGFARATVQDLID